MWQWVCYPVTGIFLIHSEAWERKGNSQPFQRSAQWVSSVTFHPHCSAVSRNTAFGGLWRICSIAFTMIRKEAPLGEGDSEQHRHMYLARCSTFVAPVAGPVQGCASSFVQAVYTHSVVQALSQPAQVAWKNFTLIKNTRKWLLLLVLLLNQFHHCKLHLWCINQQILKQDLPVNALIMVHLLSGLLTDSSNIHFLVGEVGKIGLKVFLLRREKKTYCFHLCLILKGGV